MRCLIELRSRLPVLISYDKLLHSISISQKYVDDVQNLDCLIVVSDIADDELVAAAIRNSVPVIYYVYSWDHAPKFSRIPSTGSVIATWSKPIEDDISGLHKVPTDKFVRLPPTQYAGIKDYIYELKTSGVEPEPKKNQVLFAASFGYPSLARLEVDLFISIAEMCSREHPDLELLFRGYPHLADSGIYARLDDVPNVKIDRSIFDHHRGLGHDQTIAKVDRLKESIAVLHCGTTVGIEAAICGTPVIYINIDESTTKTRHKPQGLTESWQQYHLQKYYFYPDSPNTALDLTEVSDAIHLATEDPKKLLNPYGENLVQLAGATTTEDLVRSVLDLSVALEGRLHDRPKK